MKTLNKLLDLLQVTKEDTEEEAEEEAATEDNAEETETAETSEDADETETEEVAEENRKTKRKPKKRRKKRQQQARMRTARKRLKRQTRLREQRDAQAIIDSLTARLEAQDEVIANLTARIDNIVAQLDDKPFGTQGKAKEEADDNAGDDAIMRFLQSQLQKVTR